MLGDGAMIAGGRSVLLIYKCIFGVKDLVNEIRLNVKASICEYSIRLA